MCDALMLGVDRAHNAAVAERAISSDFGSSELSANGVRGGGRTFWVILGPGEDFRW
jgi:hypothetical protein